MVNLDDHYDVDERYRAFEDHSEGILVSLAGPGTGKTFSILRRIAYLMNTQGIDAKTICYVTFIKEIARVFHSDYVDELGNNDEVVGVPRISTLHSLACRLIRNRGFSIGYDGELYFTSAAPTSDTFESKVILTDLINVINNANLNTVAKIRKSLYPVKEAWRNTTNTEELGGHEAIAHSGYLELSHAYRLIDWDHTIPLAFQIYQIPENRQRWISQINHILVDEYQDFNRAEQLLISSMVSNVSSAVIVGDDDQSLYSGRGGSPNGLRDLFVSEEADQVSLIRCYRCGSTILDHANTYLHTMNPKPRQMLPFHEGGVVESLRFKSSKAEIEYLVHFLRTCIDALPAEPRPREGIVCLFPTKNSLRFYFEKLCELIPCYTTRLDIEDSRRRLTYALSLYARPHQRFVERLLLESFPEIKPRHRKAMVNIVINRDISPAEAFQLMICEGVLTGSALGSAENFISTCNALSSQNPELIADQIEEWTEIEHVDLVNQLDDFLISLHESDQETAISDFCDNAVPSTVLPPVDLRAVPFLTMHGAKGLTKRTVIMPGLEDAWLPGTSIGSSLEEKRRLFYVALTRATDQVLITHPANRARGDPMNYETPGRSVVSRFVGESEITTRYQA